MISCKLTKPVRICLFAVMLAGIVSPVGAQGLSDTNQTSRTAERFDLLSIPVTDGFDYPVGQPNGKGWRILQEFSRAYNPQGGGWHAGEDWVIDNRNQDRVDWLNPAGQPVYAIANGLVRFASFADYKCSVVIIEHHLPNREVWFSLYGHLDRLTVNANQVVTRGQSLGNICAWPEDFPRSHLHFEIRNFYIKDAINGQAAACRLRHRNFAPGPGYWPVCGANGLERPVDEGWVDGSDFVASHRARSQSAVISRFSSGATILFRDVP